MTLKYLHRREYLPLLFLLAAVFADIMTGEAMLTAGLPHIEHEFPVEGVFESWVLPIVLLVGAAAAPFIGTAGDTYGHKRLLVICLLIYIIGLIGGYLAPDIWTLLLFRGFQGAGIAAFPLAYAIIRQQFPLQAAEAGIGVISAMYGGGTFLGVIIGSLITEYFSWRMTYLVLIPPTILITFLVFVMVKETGYNERACKPDYPGFVILLISLFFVLSALSLFNIENPFSPLPFIFMILAVFSFFILIHIERNASCPVLDIKLILCRPVMALLIIGFLTILAFFMLLQMMPYLIQMPTGLNLSESYIALILVPGAICDMCAGPLTGYLITRIGIRLPAMAGAVLIIIPVLLLLIFPPSLFLLILVWMSFSAGMSVTATAALIGAVYIVSEGRTAETTGLIQSVQTMGGMAGPVITGLILTASQSPLMHNGEIWDVPSAGGYFLVSLAIFIIGLVLLLSSWLLLEKKPLVIS